MPESTNRNHGDIDIISLAVGGREFQREMEDGIGERRYPRERLEENKKVKEQMG